MPGRDDVRRLGQHRSRGLDPHHPPRARRGHQLHRHGRRLLARGVRGNRRQGAGRRDGAIRSCSPPRCTARWATIPTSSATRAAGSSTRSRTACGGSAPTGSTSTRSTARSRTPTSTRRSARSPISCAPARFATSEARRSRPMRSSQAQWVAQRRGSRALLSASSRRTRCSSAGSRPTCCPCASSTGWA